MTIMKYITIQNKLKASQVIMGNMRTAGLSTDQLYELIQSALDNGINFFDHADIYGGGKSEAIFGEVLKAHPELREKMIIQTKCAIRFTEKGSYYDFSKEHILNSVNASLERLQCGYIDVLLLHRPDTLMEFEEVNDAFNTLYNEGKVKYFGLSNVNSMQIEMMQKYIEQPLIINQIQFNPVNSGILSNGFFVNMKDDVHGIDHDGSLLEYCRLKNITLQAWSMLQASWAEGTFLNNPDYQGLNDCLERIGQKYNISKAAVVTAWIVRHPAGIQAIAGTANPAHLADLCKGADITLSREEWYEIYREAIQSNLP